MARFAAGLLAGMVIATVAGAAVGSHADDVQAEVLSAAVAAGVRPQDLQGAINSVGVDPYTYLRSTGELPPLPKEPAASASPPAINMRVMCIIRYESENNPRAVNPQSGAAGLGQFTASTWRTTPQGRAGLSVFDAVANRAAVAYMLQAGRSREFSVVTAGLC